MGPGTIECPLKRGELAIQRCLQYQAERACTCDVYRAHPSAAPAVPAEALCGRQLDGSLQQQLLVNAAAPNAPKALDGEEDSMATNAHTRGRCASCGNTAPKGTRLVAGRCRDCRDGKAPVLARVPKQQTLPTVADQRIAELELALADKDRELARLRWKLRHFSSLVEAVSQGWTNIEKLAAELRDGATS
jgi:hypothetical protein